MNSLARAISIFINVVEWLLIARVFAGFIIRDSRQPVYNFLIQVTEPLLDPFKNLIHKLNINVGMFDFTPLLAFLTLELIKTFTIGLLR